MGDDHLRPRGKRPSVKAKPRPCAKRKGAAGAAAFFNLEPNQHHQQQQGDAVEQARGGRDRRKRTPSGAKAKRPRRKEPASIKTRTAPARRPATSPRRWIPLRRCEEAGATLCNPVAREDSRRRGRDIEGDHPRRAKSMCCNKITVEVIARNNARSDRRARRWEIDVPDHRPETLRFEVEGVDAGVADILVEARQGPTSAVSRPCSRLCSYPPRKRSRKVRAF